jgi:hypothetical protein
MGHYAERHPEVDRLVVDGGIAWQMEGKEEEDRKN